MDFSKEAIEKIVELNEKGNLITDASGRQWSTKNFAAVIFNPMVSPIELKSLEGFAGYVNTQLRKDGIDGVNYYAHVNCFDSVSLRSNVFGEDRKREVIAEATLDKNLQCFPFGRYLDHDDFVIKLCSLFQKTDDLDYLLRYVFSVTSNGSVNVEDDGITQRTTVKKGVSGALSGEETAKSIVSLKPYRTFREIQQPESQFLFRVQEGPGFALFEADGGTWRLNAVQNIVEYLRDRIDDKEFVVLS